MDLKEVFDKFEDEYIKFDRVTDRLSERPDLHAFLLLDRLLPGKKGNMVAAAQHDKIWLDTDCERLAEVATEADILTLVRCGVMYDDDYESLAMFA